MNILVNQILDLSGPLPDPDRYKRYLQTLDGRTLRERLDALEAEVGRPRVESKWTNLRIKMATTATSKRLKAVCG